MTNGIIKKMPKNIRKHLNNQLNCQDKMESFYYNRFSAVTSEEGTVRTGSSHTTSFFWSFLLLQFILCCSNLWTALTYKDVKLMAEKLLTLIYSLSFHFYAKQLCIYCYFCGCDGERQHTVKVLFHDCCLIFDIHSKAEEAWPGSFLFILFFLTFTMSCHVHISVLHSIFLSLMPIINHAESGR